LAIFFPITSLLTVMRYRVNLHMRIQINCHAYGRKVHLVLRVPASIALDRKEKETKRLVPCANLCYCQALVLKMCTNFMAIKNTSPHKACMLITLVV